MNKFFPRTNVGGVSLSRMIIGTNWILGYSHTSSAADCLIRQKHNIPENTINLLEVFLNAGVDTIMGPFASNPALVNAIRAVEDKTGKGIIIVDTPIINVDDNPFVRKEAADTIASGWHLWMEHFVDCIMNDKEPEITTKHEKSL